MLKKAVLLACAVWSVVGPAWGAALQNTDSQPYDLLITEPGRPYASGYRVVENSQVDICFQGCRITLTATGQTVDVGPNDTVVIDSGVMTVTSP